ncbi:MAG TPA: class I SAM-dependent methyltransferase [Geobacteraceae bacterium]|nr:class I SAM-dependent methyltransferase [Geobacteraceae bacterium]
MSKRFPGKEEIRAFYDRFGSMQDWQRFYEGAAIRDLLRYGRFDIASSVFELGCGTGSFALGLLRRHLPETASYVGVDISSTMARLAGKRLVPFAGRARILHTDGSLRFGFPDGSFDRFVAVYVLDLLSPDEIVQVFGEAYRLLRNEGRICLVSLTFGQTVLSRTVTWIWKGIHNLNPLLVGGCRPLKLRRFLEEECWNISHHKFVNVMGIASEIVVAVKITGKLQHHENSGVSPWVLLNSDNKRLSGH